MSRKGTNFSSWFPELAELTSDVASVDALLDGEVIAGAGDVESFNTLLRRARLRGRSASSALPVSFVAFDLLWHDGADLTQQSLEERRERLRAIVTETSRLAVSRVYADGGALLSIAAAHGLEGIVAKDRRSVYEPGRRSRSWLKTKVPGAHPVPTKEFDDVRWALVACDEPVGVFFHRNLLGRCARSTKALDDMRLHARLIIL